MISLSWGTSWGEHGFIRLKKTSSSGSAGMCHITYRPAMIVGGRRTSMWGIFDNSTSIIGGGVTALIGIVIICALFILGLRRFHKKNGRYSYGIIKDENEDVDGHISISKFSQELQGSHRNDAGDGDDKIDENNKERVDGDVTIGRGSIISISTEYQSI